MYTFADELADRDVDNSLADAPDGMPRRRRRKRPPTKPIPSPAIGTPGSTGVPAPNIPLVAGQAANQAAGTPPPLPSGQPMGDAVRRAVAPPLPTSGGNLGSAPYNAPLDPGPVTPDYSQMGPVRVGTPISPHLNRTGRKLEEIRTMQDASPSSTVMETPGYGYEVLPPEKSPSRLKQALIGALQGAVIGGQHGLSGAIGGAAAGAGAGAIKPRLMQALTRDQEIKHLQSQLGTDLELQKGAAQIGGIQAQTEENRAQAEYYRAQRGTQERTRAIQLYRALPHYKRGEDPELDAYFDEAGLPVVDKEGKDDGTKVEYVDPEGHKFLLSPEQAAQRYQQDRAIKNRSNSSDSEAEEGEAQARLAEQDSKGMADAIAKWDADNATDDKYLRSLEAEWNAEAARQHKEAMAEWKATAVDKGPKPKLSEILEEVRAADPRYSKYYLTTKENRDKREKDIAALKKRLEELNDRKRAGQVKTAKGGSKRSKKAKGSDGKYHYTIDEIRRLAGDNFDGVLKILQSDPDTVID